jgi:nucleotide-binding universal stress UspA family protein
MGSVSESVVRHAHCSVLVVRGQDRDGGYLPGRVLLALDGSKGAGEAERIAAEISAATGSVLDIVRVLEAELYRPYPGPEYREGWEADLERSKRQVRAFLDERARSLRDEGVEVGDAHLGLGDPDKEIVKFAEDAHADLIVLGAAGLGASGEPCSAASLTPWYATLTAPCSSCARDPRTSPSSVRARNWDRAPSQNRA